MTERTVLVWPEPGVAGYKRIPEQQVSVPWCTSHDTPIRDIRTSDDRLVCWWAWAVQLTTNGWPGQDCERADGVVWKVVTDD